MVPRPPRGYWAKLEVGKAPPKTPLPKRKSDGATAATITRNGQLAEDVKPEIARARQTFAEVQERNASIEVPERLAKPHPIIAKWVSQKKERQERARRERDPWARSFNREADFTANDRRRHRILHALFNALEKEGGTIGENARKELRYEHNGVTVEFQLREKFKQVRRPLTEREQRYRLSTDKDWRLDLEPTGQLLFEFKTYSLGGLRKNWLETEAKPMETLLPGIFATFVAAIPLLVEEKRQRDETARRWREAEQRRAEDEQRRRIDDARWRKFVELAGKMRQADLAREFLQRIKDSAPDPGQQAGANSLGEWLRWAEGRIAATDPLQGDAAEIFAEIALTDQWTYRD